MRVSFSSGMSVLLLHVYLLPEIFEIKDLCKSPSYICF